MNPGSGICGNREEHVLARAELAAENDAEHHTDRDHDDSEQQVALERARPRRFGAARGDDDARDGEYEREQERIRRAARGGREPDRPDPPRDRVQRARESPRRRSTARRGELMPRAVRRAADGHRRARTRAPRPTRASTNAGTATPSSTVDAAPAAFRSTISGAVVDVVAAARRGHRSPSVGAVGLAGVVVVDDGRAGGCRAHGRHRGLGRRREGSSARREAGGRGDVEVVVVVPATIAAEGRTPGLAWLPNANAMIVPDARLVARARRRRCRSTSESAGRAK